MTRRGCTISSASQQQLGLPLQWISAARRGAASLTCGQLAGAVLAPEDHQVDNRKLQPPCGRAEARAANHIERLRCSTMLVACGTPCDGHRCCRWLSARCCAPALPRRPARRLRLAIVRLVVLRREHRAGELARKVRLGAPRLRRRIHCSASELLLEAELMVAALVIAVRATTSVPSVASSTSMPDAASNFLRECGPARLTCTPELNQGFLARLGLAQAASIRAAWLAPAPRPRRGRIPQPDAPVPQPPGDTQTDDAGPMMATSGFWQCVRGARQPSLPSLE